MTGREVVRSAFSVRSPESLRSMLFMGPEVYLDHGTVGLKAMKIAAHSAKAKYSLLGLQPTLQKILCWA